jgi:hypothetical protein
MEQSLLPVVQYGLTKKQIGELALVVVSSIADGEVSGDRILLMAEQLKAVEEFTKTLKENTVFMDAIRTEIGRHPGGFASPSGAKLEAMEAGVRYDYSVSGKWQQLKQQVDIATASLKAYEDWMKKIPQGQVWPDPETGEAVPAPPKSSTSTYKITLAK